MVDVPSYVPERGDVVWISLTPHAGHEQAGRRPAVVLTPKEYNRRSGLAILCPVTSQVKGYPFEVRLPAGLPVTGAILSDQVRSLDWRARSARLICTLPPVTTSQTLARLTTLFTAYP